MSITYCSRISCVKVSCIYHQNNAPKDRDISITNRNKGCYKSADEPKFYYCILSDCVKKDCRFHLSTAPKGVVVESTDQDLGCYVGPYNRRKDLLRAICVGTQKTNYKCSDACKALCDSNGSCAYCSTIADSIEEVIK